MRIKYDIRRYQEHQVSVDEVTEDFATFASIMKMFVSEHKRKVLLLIVLGMIEIFSRILSTTDYISGREHKFWKVISTSKS